MPDEITSILASLSAIAAAIGTIVARFKATPSTLGFFARLFRALDLSQVFDSSRSLEDTDPE